MYNLSGARQIYPLFRGLDSAVSVKQSPKGQSSRSTGHVHSFSFSQTVRFFHTFIRSFIRSFSRSLIPSHANDAGSSVSQSRHS